MMKIKPSLKTIRYLLIALLIIGGINMTLEISGKLFGQEDVRETPTSSATYHSGVGIAWTCSGLAFSAAEPDVKDLHYSVSDGRVTIDANDVTLSTPVFLPHGAEVTHVVVYGNIADESYSLIRAEIDSLANLVTMATANIGTEDSSISSATIDNENYRYFLATSSLDATDRVYGARIKYN